MRKRGEDVDNLVKQLRLARKALTKAKKTNQRLLELLNTTSKHREEIGNAMILIRGAIYRWEHGEPNPHDARYQDPISI